MSSPDLESQPGETSPLLGSTRSQHEDAPEDTTTPPTQEQQDAPEDNDRLAWWFLGALASGIITFAFLGTHWVMADYGWQWYHYREYAFDYVREAMFWTLLVSIIFSIANLVRIRATRKPLAVAFNVVFLGALTFTLLYAVSSIVTGLSWSNGGHCSRNDWDHSPEPPGSVEDCLKWAPKMQVIDLFLTAFAAFHALIIARLFFALLEQVFGRTSRYFRGDRSQGCNQIYFQVSIGWGTPRQEDAVESHPRQESTTAE